MNSPNDTSRLAVEELSFASTHGTSLAQEKLFKADDVQVDHSLHEIPSCDGVIPYRQTERCRVQVGDKLAIGILEFSE